MTDVNSKVRLAIVGSVALDTIETPYESGSDLLGGSVSYACAAASFFTRVGMVGVVGNDFDDKHTDLYSKFGIDITGLQKVEGKTFKWSGVYDDDMINRRTVSTELNVFESFSPKLPECYVDAPFILLGNISPRLQLEVLSQIKNPVFVAADTMDLWIDVARGELMEVISKVNMLLVNDSEARRLTGEYNLKVCADRILSMGPDYVVIKKGEHGAMLFSKEGIFIIPAYPVADVKDPTGAGDSFAGGFMGVLSRRDSFDERSLRGALLYGSVVASFGVETFSLNRYESLNLLDIEKRRNELVEMTSACGGRDDNPAIR